MLDCRCLSHERRGIGNYTLGLYSALLRSTQPRFRFQFMAYPGQKLPGWFRGVLVIVMQTKGISSEERTSAVTEAVRSAKPEIFLTTSWLDRYAINPCAKALAPNTECYSVLHDLIPLRGPSSTRQPGRMLREYKTRLRALRSCKRVFANSAFTAKDAVGLLTNCVWIGTGTDSVPPRLSTETLTSRLRKHGITKRYVFYQTAFDKHKGIADLYWQYRQLSSHIRENLVLVLGMAIPSWYMEEHKMVDTGIVVTGWLSASDKHALHTGAWLFVGASEAEGFGMTIAESLAHKTPTIVADSTAQRELITDRGFRFAHSNNELAGLITALWHNSSLYQRCKLHTAEMAGRLDTWDRVVKRLTGHLA